MVWVSCVCSSYLTLWALEYVLFARPESMMDGVDIDDARLNMVEYLGDSAAKALRLGDIVVVMPIPDSSRPSAMQLAARLDLSYREGFIKNRYVGRTFIMPGQEIGRAHV